MHLDLISFAFGIIIALSMTLVVEKVYGLLFGNRRQRELAREVKRLQSIIRKKDELIKKSLKTMQDEELKNNEQE